MSSKRKPRTNSKSKGSRFVPYAQGFRVPNEEEQINAIGITSKHIPPQFDANSDANFFPAIPRPTSIDDWLAQYDEDGQTFAMFLKECPWLSSRKVKHSKHKFVSNGKGLVGRYPEGKIYIIPVGPFDDKSSLAFADLIDYANRFLCLPVETLPDMNMEFDKGQLYLVESAGVHISGRKSRGRRSQMDIRYNAKSDHMQLNVDCILKELRKKIPPDAICVIGLTMYDLYGDDTDLFVAGMAAGNQRVAVFSVLRYDPRLTFSREFWFDIRQSEKVSNDERAVLILQRSCKLVVHEISHLLGIDHCIYYDCCMNGSGHLAEDFRQPMHLCPVDLHKLKVLTGFDVTERYRRLQEFYQKHGMVSEEGWVQRRIQFIEAEEVTQQT